LLRIHILIYDPADKNFPPFWVCPVPVKPKHETITKKQINALMVRYGLLMTFLLGS
jgi:hypothetical protein